MSILMLILLIAKCMYRVWAYIWTPPVQTLFPSSASMKVLTDIVVLTMCSPSYSIILYKDWESIVKTLFVNIKYFWPNTSYKILLDISIVLNIFFIVRNWYLNWPFEVLNTKHLNYIRCLKIANTEHLNCIFQQ